MILSSVAVALLAAIFALIVSSTSHRRIVLSGIEVTTLSEAIERAPYLPCGTADDYADVVDLPLPDQLAGLTASLDSVRYLRNSSDSSAEFESRPSCDSQQGDDKGVQSIRVRVTRSDPNGAQGTSGSETVDFAKRDNRCNQYQREVSEYLNSPLTGPSC